MTRMVSDIQEQVVREAGFSDLSMRQITFLELVQYMANPTPGELARELKISKPSVSALIERLEAAGYIRKVESDGDRRSYHLHLTEKGEQFSLAHDTVHHSLAQFITRNLDVLETSQLTRLVDKILNG
jgi:DNA-binding MarR family transcriptional regulator